MERPLTFSLNQTQFFYLFQKQKFSDVTIVCDGEIIKCHRFILAASSDYFNDLFTLLPDGNNTVIVLKDINKNQLMKILEFIYCGKISVCSKDVKELKHLADYFKLKIEFPTEDIIRSEFNDTVPEMMSQSMISQEFMSQETTIGDLTIETFQISSEFENFEEIDESSNDSESTLVSRTSSIKLAKDKKNEPLMKKPKMEALQAENKIKCVFCQKYVSERLATDHRNHCFKNRHRQSLKCGECRKDFELSNRLRNHILKMHPVKQSHFPNSLF